MRLTGQFMVALGMLLSAAPAVRALTPQQKCHAGKNQEAGKYAACRQKAEATLIKSGDLSKYNTAIGRCESKFQDKWQKLIDAATAAGATCPDAPLTRSQFQTVIDEHADNIAEALGGGGLEDCAGDLAGCTAELGTCNTELSSCNNSLSSCATSLATCNAGTATSGEVLAGRTFSSGSGLGLTGAMPNQGGILVTPGTAPQTIPAGYHDGTGSVEGDGHLLPGNIVSGVNIFGVTGTAPTSTCGNGIKDGAEQCDGLDLGGQTCGGLGYALGGSLTCTPGCGFNTSSCLGQALPASGQTACWDGSGVVIPCAGTGQDGDVQAGTTLGYQDNGDGTITDRNTGLMWEKKSDDGGLHDKDNSYYWSCPVSGSCSPGTIWDWLALVNAEGGTGFAGYSDWRIPNKKELESILDLGHALPAVDPVFATNCGPGSAGNPGCSVITCSCTHSDTYFVSTSVMVDPANAWRVHFNWGGVDPGTKREARWVRAVRGGL